MAEFMYLVFMYLEMISPTFSQEYTLYYTVISTAK